MKNKRYSKNTPNKGFNFNPTNFYEDWDHDGIMNGLDCYPLDKKRQAISHMISAAPSAQARIIPPTPTAQLVSAIKSSYVASPAPTLYTPKNPINTSRTYSAPMNQISNRMNFIRQEQQINKNRPSKKSQKIAQ